MTGGGFDHGALACCAFNLKSIGARIRAAGNPRDCHFAHPWNRAHNPCFRPCNPCGKRGRGRWGDDDNDDFALGFNRAHNTFGSRRGRLGKCFPFAPFCDRANPCEWDFEFANWGTT